MIIKCFFDGSRVLPVDEAHLRSVKSELSKGQVLAVTIELWEDARTRRQSNLLHELLGRHARAEGVQMQWLKDRIKYDLGHYIPMHRIYAGDVEPPSWRGKIIDVHTLDKSARVHQELSLILLRSEADYTRAMERDFIDRVIYECQESGTDIDDILRTLHELNKEEKNETA